MPATTTKFDPPARWLALSELPRTLVELYWMPAWSFFVPRLPAGDGHAVMLIPGFLTSGRSLGVLRDDLEALGYRVRSWGQGRNLGLRGELLEGAKATLQDLYEESGGKVSLIGQSLGGLYARELAWEVPEKVRQVITIGSPFLDTTGSGASVGDFYFRLNPLSRLPQAWPGVPAERAVRTLDVPSTAIFSRQDGVVNWKSCMELSGGERTENVEVLGSHCAMGFNPLVVVAVADRLAQAEGEWAPFRREGWRRAAFPEPPSLEEALEWAPPELSEAELSVDALLREHGHIGIVLEALEEAIDEAEGGDRGSYARARQILRYLDEFIDEHHHPREDLISARLEKKLKKRGWANGLVTEHEDLVAAGDALAGRLGRRRLSQSERETLFDDVRVYVETLRRHLAWEEQELFPLASEKLDERDWRAVRKRAPAPEDPLFGEVPTAPFRSLYRWLTETADAATEDMVKRELAAVDALVGTAAVYSSLARRTIGWWGRLLLGSPRSVAGEADDTGRA